MVLSKENGKKSTQKGSEIGNSDWTLTNTEGDLLENLMRYMK